VNQHKQKLCYIEDKPDHTVLMGILAWAIKQGYKP
jgi:hypothetical protein